MSENCEVLIIGAGPTGLMLACQLAIHDVKFRIIDKNQYHTTQSRALIVQARSLEILEQMGISDKAIDMGVITGAVQGYFNGQHKLYLKMKDFDKDLTNFPYVLILEQSATEKILSDFLQSRDIRVERHIKLVDFEQDENGVTTTIQHNDGRVEKVVSKYIIGADGASSQVREKIGYSFEGTTYDPTLYVLDCKADIKSKKDEVIFNFSDKSTFTGFFPLTHDNHRIIGILPQELEGKHDISFSDLNQSFMQDNTMNVTLSDPLWLSVYKAHHRYAPSFRSGRAFIAGDAAHIHSPIGGQGMNTGLQDSYNLAWKLSLVLKGKAGEKLLNTYSEERLKIAQKLVNTTDKAFHLIVSKKHKKLRKILIPVLIRSAKFLITIRKVRSIIFKTLSETSVNYRKSSLSQKASRGGFPVTAPHVGDRAPCSISSYLTGKKFHLIFFGIPQQSGWFKIREFADKNIGLFSVHLISPSLERPYLIKQFGIVKCGIYLIRPDMYIAYRSSVPDHEHFIKYVEQYLIF